MIRRWRDIDWVEADCIHWAWEVDQSGRGVGVGCSVDRAEVMAFIGHGKWS